MLFLEDCWRSNVDFRKKLKEERMLNELNEIQFASNSLCAKIESAIILAKGQDQAIARTRKKYCQGPSLS